MAAAIIDGRRLAAQVRSECRERVQALVNARITPQLAVVLAGDEPASRIYVQNKLKACEEVGVASTLHALPHDAAEEDVLSLIRALNADPHVHGILVQLPLPPQISAQRVIFTIEATKDVDGFHLYNVGALAAGEPTFAPCTPQGVMRLLDAAAIPIEGQHAVVVGASNIVGKPMAMMLMRRHATVTVCHVKTRDLRAHTLQADILVVAAGRPGLIKADMVRPGGTVIDVGINRLPDGSIVGDVDFAAVATKAGHITPVPGGVGPMTIAMLMLNTVEAAAAQSKFRRTWQCSEEWHAQNADLQKAR